MSGSVAEERIRTGVEALFRARFPEARIIHELVLDQGGVRIDLAAVGRDCLAVAEIKSERDVLNRLKAQVEVAVRVAQEVWVFVAPKHAAALAARTEPSIWRDIYGPPGLKHQGGWMNPTPRRSFPNPEHLPELDDCHLRVEVPGANFEPLQGCGWAPRLRLRSVNPADPLQMLWREELAALTRPLGSGPKATRGDMMWLAVEHLSGKEIRRGGSAARCARGPSRARTPDWGSGVTYGEALTAARQDVEEAIRDFLAELSPAEQQHHGFQLVAVLTGALAVHGHSANLTLLLRTLADHAALGPPTGRVQ